MDKKRLSIILTIFFLVQSVPAAVLSQETCLLNPPTKVNINDTSFSFKRIYDTVYLGLLMYKLDAIERCSKYDIISKYGDKVFGLSAVRFDLEHMDMGKRGWTRYYPFSIDGRQFIMRIFLTEERSYQAYTKVIFEMNIESPNITLQILPGINAILESCRIAPHTFYYDRQAAVSP